MLIAALLIARLFPQTPTGRWLHWLLVDEPMRIVSRLTMRDVVLAIVVVLAFQAFAVTFTMDLALIAAVDTTAYLEVATAVWSAAALAKARIAWAAVRSAGAATRRRAGTATRLAVQSIRRVRHRTTIELRKALVPPEEDRRRMGALARA